jgi:hypothetical protein
MTNIATGGPGPGFPGGYTVREVIRAGRHTVLYSAHRGPAAEPVAVKIPRQKSTGHEAAIRAALAALPAHPHLIGALGTDLDRSGVYMWSRTCARKGRWPTHSGGPGSSPVRRRRSG